MGASASVLTEQQKSLVAQGVKDEFYKLKAENKDEVLIREYLVAKYDDLMVESIKVDATDAVATFPSELVAREIESELVTLSQSYTEEGKEAPSLVIVSTPRAEVQKSETKNVKPATPATNSKSKPKTATRRRSFEDRTYQKKSPATQRLLATSASEILPTVSVADQLAAATAALAEATAATVAIAATGDSSAETAVDHWDSVSEQPFCAVCGMAFKSAAFLERHVKYSDVHVKNLQRRKLESEAAKALAAAKARGDVDEPANSKPVQQEGVHYKALYTGSKFFWRSNETIDLNFYHHMLPNCIEVIGFHVENHVEFSRLYFDFTKLYNLVRDEVKEKTSEERQLAAKDRFKKLPPDDVLKADVKRRLMTSYLLARLQLLPSKLDFVMLAEEDLSKTPLLAAPPVVLAPLSVKRRRKTNSEEIETTIKDLAEDRAALSAATQKAERIAGFVFEGVAMLTNGKDMFNGLSVPQKRWRIAIVRVLNQIRKTKTKVRLSQKL